MFGPESAGPLNDTLAPDPATDTPHIGSTTIRPAGCIGGNFRTGECER